MGQDQGTLHILSRSRYELSGYQGGRFPKGTAPSQRTPEVGRYLDPADAFDDDDDDEPFLP